MYVRLIHKCITIHLNVIVMKNLKYLDFIRFLKYVIKSNQLEDLKLM